MAECLFAELPDFSGSAHAELLTKTDRLWFRNRLHEMDDAAPEFAFLDPNKSLAAPTPNHIRSAAWQTHSLRALNANAGRRARSRPTTHRAS